MKRTSSNDNNLKQSKQWILPLLLTVFAGLGFKLIWEKSGHTLVAIWNWLWGMPIESGGKIAVEAARESLKSMQQSIAQLAESVATAVAAYENVKTKYAAKHQEFKQAENQALLACQHGNEEAARLAMSRAIGIERLLPKIAEQVAQAEKVVVSAKEKLRREREKLEAYQTEMQNLKTLAEINEALETIAQVDSSLDINSARYQFESAQAAVEERYLKANAQAEIFENPAERLQADLDHLMLNDEISHRLDKLKASGQLKRVS
ncbi:PspA/IM30 family protein [Aerosakkonemataceae cyanobacterium BLCC-F50]|uniref:PspA/IM30 family protein n=1 Tax=Floridaenema flaviceps BLCC-F50 TaxID=3153642 RepID=A0ABV4XSS4_9CYAN